MPEVDRRRFLAGAGALLAAPTLVRRPLAARAQPAAPPFTWGVASFDPTPSSVLLWTRVEHAPGAGAVALRWVLAADEALEEPVAEGEVEASEVSGWCASADVTDLPPGAVWWFAFTAPDGARSPVGRTRTMPSDGGAGLRVAAVSCARFAAGGFAAYRALAEREVDVVVHLGDYIYDDGATDVRAHQPAHELRTLDDYRARYAQHRADPDLQALHARHPMVAIWDDHDIAGNAWREGARGHDDATDGPWAARVDAAMRAQSEWLPGRTAWSEGRLQGWRSIALGPLAELIVLDTRLWGRDEQAGSAADLSGSSDRSMLGKDQMAFVAGRLAAPNRAPWALLANQVMLHSLRVAVPTEALAAQVEEAGFLVVEDQAVNPDQWDGYPAAREELTRAMGGRGGVVVLTGDVHSSWAWEGPANDGGRPAMVELVAPSISSEPFGDRLPLPAPAVEAALSGLDPALAFVEIQSHGYLLVDLTAERVQGEWWYVEPDDPGSQRFGAAVRAPIGVPMELTEVDEPTDDPAPPTTAAGTTTTVAPVPEEPTADDADDLPVVAIGGAAAAVLGGLIAAAVALRRRRT